MNKEFFECDEYIKSKEIQYFPAEKYHVKETENNAEETFNSPETSVSQGHSAKTDDSGLSLSDAEEVVQSASVSASAATSTSASLSASASASVGISGVVAGIAAVCVAVTVGIVPVAGITPDTVDEPPVYQIEEIDVGTLSFSNYRIDYYEDEDSGNINSDITFYFEGELADGFTCELSDVQTGRSVAVDENTVTFENVEKGDREFLLSIYNGEEVAETRMVNVEDNYVNTQGLDTDYAYKVTYNSDNTSNLYAYFLPGHEGDFVTYINIYGLSEVADYDYETVIDGNLSYVLNIQEEKYNAEFVSYYVKDNNYYSYFSLDEIIIGDALLEWSASASDDKLTLSFGNDVFGIVEVKVTHDDLSCEELSFMADELVNNAYELTLSRISHNLTVEVFVSPVLYDFDPLKYISETVGVEYKSVNDSVGVAAFVSSNVSLIRCEIFNPSYNYDYDDTSHAPVYLYFDGFLNEGDTYSVKVLGSDGNEVTSLIDLTLSDKPVTFVDLLADTEYTFNIYLTAGGEETLSCTITKTLSIPEFSDLPSLFCLSPNPGDVMITYNGDGTSNVYLYMDVQTTIYNMYYKVYLVDVASDGQNFFEYAGKEDVAIFKNVPTGIYSIKYGVLLNDNGTCYSVYDLQWPSGTIVTGLDDSGYYPESVVYTNYDNSTGELFISVSGKVVGDLHITITPNDGGQPIKITIPVADISTGYESSTCSLDLTAYGLTSFTVVVEGEAVFQYGKGDTIKNEVTVTGKESCPFKEEKECTAIEY